MSKRAGGKECEEEEEKPGKKAKEEEKKEEMAIADPQLATILQAIKDGQQENRQRFDTLEGKVNRVDGKVDNLEDEVSTLKQRVAALEVDSSSSASVASGSTAVPAPRKKAKFRQPEHFSFADTDLEPENWRYAVPPTRRRVLVVGKLHEFEKDEVDSIGEELAKQIGVGFEKEIERFEAPFKLGSILRIVCRSNSAMWGILRKMKNRKFTDPSDSGQQLWHGIDKSLQERELGKRVGKALVDIKSHMKSALSLEDVEKLANGDRDTGLVWLRLPGKRTVRVFQADSNKEFLVIVPTYDKALSGGYEAEQALDEINNLC